VTEPFSPDDDSPFLNRDDLLSSSWALRRKRKQPQPEEDLDEDLVELNFEELEDVDPLFPAGYGGARDQLKAWCESVDDDVWVLDLDADD
jgi:hypothetical protein